jgi:hypothetical protein
MLKPKMSISTISAPPNRRQGMASRKQLRNFIYPCKIEFGDHQWFVLFYGMLPKTDFMRNSITVITLLLKSQIESKYFTKPY